MPKMNIQAPPNLSDPHYADLLDAVQRLGGVSPLTPILSIRKSRAASGTVTTAHGGEGFELRQRLPVIQNSSNSSQNKQRHTAICWRSG